MVKVIDKSEEENERKRRDSVIENLISSNFPELSCDVHSGMVVAFSTEPRKNVLTSEIGVLNKVKVYDQRYTQRAVKYAEELEREFGKEFTVETLY